MEILTKPLSSKPQSWWMTTLAAWLRPTFCRLGPVSPGEPLCSSPHKASPQTLPSHPSPAAAPQSVNANLEIRFRGKNNTRGGSTLYTAVPDPGETTEASTLQTKG